MSGLDKRARRAAALGTFVGAWGLVMTAGAPTVSRADETGISDVSGRPSSDTTGLQAVTEAARERLAALAEGGAGLQAAIVHDGSLVWTDAFGPADAGTGRQVTDSTLFRIYSLSKPLTAVATVRLAGAGSLDLSAPVQRYVPSFPEKAGTITPMHLIRHTSGIRHYREGEAASRRHCATVEEALAIFRDDPLVHAPGEGETYSTWGYVLLSAVLEGAASADYDAVMRQAVLEPAGMTRTDLPHSPDSGGQGAERAAPYRMDPAEGLVPARPVDVSCKWGGGAWLSTAGDLGRFFAGALDGTLLPTAMARQLTGGEPVYEGMGVGPGGLALVRADLDRGVALVVLTNAPGEAFGPAVRGATDELFRELQGAVESAGTR